MIKLNQNVIQNIFSSPMNYHTESYVHNLNQNHNKKLQTAIITQPKKLTIF